MNKTIIIEIKDLDDGRVSIETKNLDVNNIKTGAENLAYSILKTLNAIIMLNENRDENSNK